MDNIIIIAAVIAIFLAIFVNRIIKKIFPVQIGTISAFSKRAVTIWVICFILCLYGLTALFGPKKEEASTEDISYTEEDYWQEDSGTDEDVIMEDSVDDINDDVDIDQMKQEALGLVEEFSYDIVDELVFIDLGDEDSEVVLDPEMNTFAYINTSEQREDIGKMLEECVRGTVLCKANEGYYYLVIEYITTDKTEYDVEYEVLNADVFRYDNEWQFIDTFEDEFYDESRFE